MLLMRSLTSPISSTEADRLSTASVIAFASSVACVATFAEFATRAAICSIDCAISSAAVATMPTFVVACSDAAAVASACSWLRLALFAISRAEVSMALAARSSV